LVLEEGSLLFEFLMLSPMIFIKIL